MTGRRDYSAIAVERAREDALEWLKRSPAGTGAPKSWQQLDKDDQERGRPFWDDFIAPPIAGYELLEKQGLAERLGPRFMDTGDERILFRLIKD